MAGAPRVHSHSPSWPAEAGHPRLPPPSDVDARVFRPLNARPTGVYLRIRPLSNGGPPLIADLSPLDAGAVVLFLATWFAYHTLFDSRFRRPASINAKMIAVREAWMLELLSRENRIVDSTLIGHSIHSASFFASTTILLVAGLVGVIGSADRIYGATVNLSMIFHTGTQALFQLKVLLLIAIFIYAFIKFTWAIRQFNYFAAIIGGAPPASSAPSDRALAMRMAMVLSNAIWQFNAGVRAYYFAFAALAWFVHPLFFMIMTVLIPIVLAYRQLWSATARAIADHVDSLG